MSSGNNNKRKSRWGAAADDARAATASRNNTNSVSDEDAVAALLAEATRQQEEKQQQAMVEREKRQAQEARKRPRKHQEHASSSIKMDPANDYYGPGGGGGGGDDSGGEKKPSAAEEEEEEQEKAKPNFGLSGALAKDESGGAGSNVYKGVLLKFQEPPEARTPGTLWRFYVFKGETQIDTLHVSKQSAYLWGRNEDIADIPLQHASCSSQHAVLQYRALPNKETGKLSCQPYLMDLESTNGSFINGVRIDSARYYQLKKGDVLRFGASTREYVLMAAKK